MRGPDLVQKVFGICEAKNGTAAHEMSADWNRWAPKNLAKCRKESKLSKKEESQSKQAKNWRIEGEKEKNYEKGVSEAGKQV